MEPNQTVPGLDRGLSSNLLLQKSQSYVKLIEECVMCTKKHGFVKNV